MCAIATYHVFTNAGKRVLEKISRLKCPVSDRLFQKWLYVYVTVTAPAETSAADR